MIDRLVADANAAIDFIRPGRADPPPLRDTRLVLLPLQAVGELFAGAHQSARVEENLGKIEELLTSWAVLHPDVATARIYGQLRRTERATRTSLARMNDLWIAALCLQHDLPLLTNDRGFDAVPGLHVLHW